MQSYETFSKSGVHHMAFVMVQMDSKAVFMGVCAIFHREKSGVFLFLVNLLSMKKGRQCRGGDEKTKGGPQASAGRRRTKRLLTLHTHIYFKYYHYEKKLIASGKRSAPVAGVLQR
jgi:hypothetical protein